VSEVVLFHHAQGLTDGVRAFADALGGVVHTPDLFDGATFATLDAGMAHVEELGFDTVLERGRAAVEHLPAEVVYVGLSLGVMPAQLLAQTRPGARGAVLCHAAIPLGEFAPSWPRGVALQLHVAEEDPLGDVADGFELAEAVPWAQFFTYPGDAHLFTDASLPVYDPGATSLVLERIRTLLDG